MHKLEKMIAYELLNLKKKKKNYIALLYLLFKFYS